MTMVKIICLSSQKKIVIHFWNTTVNVPDWLAVLVQDWCRSLSAGLWLGWQCHHFLELPPGREENMEKRLRREGLTFKHTCLLSSKAPRLRGTHHWPLRKKATMYYRAAFLSFAIRMTNRMTKPRTTDSGGKLDLMFNYHCKLIFQ